LRLHCHFLPHQIQQNLLPQMRRLGLAWRDIEVSENPWFSNTKPQLLYSIGLFIV
jgi:hypothetical protein